MSAQEREALIRLVWDDETTYAEAADLADSIIAAGWSRPVSAGGEVEDATEDVIEQAAEVITRTVVGPAFDPTERDVEVWRPSARALAAAGLLAGGVPGRKSLLERARERGIVPDSTELDLVTGRRVVDEPVPGRSEAETDCNCYLAMTDEDPDDWHSEDCPNWTARVAGTTEAGDPE